MDFLSINAFSQIFITYQSRNVLRLDIEEPHKLCEVAIIEWTSKSELTEDIFLNIKEEQTLGVWLCGTVRLSGGSQDWLESV